jgi:hypothetical protein
MKRVLVFILAVVVLTAAMTMTAFGAEADSVKEAPDIKIVIDGALTSYKNVPVSVNGSNLLPLRELLVNLGVPNDDDHIIYKSADKSVTIIYGQTTILLKIGDTTAYVNGEPIKLNAAPILYKNSTFIPIRFVAEAMGKKVVWDGKTRTVLVCDAAKFESVQQLLNKSNEAAAKVGKYKMGMELNATVDSGAMKTIFGVKADAAVDKAGKKMHMGLLMNMLGIEIKSDSYYADNKAYSLNPLNGQWEKKTYTEKEYNEMFESQANNQIKTEEALCAGLVIDENAGDDGIVLSGDVYLADLYNNTLEQQSSLLGKDADTAENTPKFDTYNIRIVLDKDTYLVKSLVMKVSAQEDNGSGQKQKTDVTVSMSFSEYDGGFSVVVPEEVAKKAVEVKTDEKSATSVSY